jgi:D-alanine--poly(phosphoribitol) ligase subunit 1
VKLFANLAQWARQWPDRPAHIGVNAQGTRESLTYGELIARAGCLAAQLRRELPADRSPVIVLGHKEPEMLVGFLGVVGSGHPYVPLDDSLPAARIAAVLASSGARLTLTPASIAAICAQTPAGVVPRLTAPEPDDPFYIIFTSGSTGQPKGVQITAGCVQTFLDWLCGEQCFRIGEETFLNQAPFSFDLSVMDLYGSLATGGTLYSITRAEIAQFKALFQAVYDSNVTVWVSTPSFAQVCLLEKTFAAARLPGMRKFLFCGETLNPGTARQLLDRFPGAAVWNTYGPTEATVAATSVRVDRELLEHDGPLPVGFPMPSGAIEIHDQEGRAQPAGERGEIVIAGPNVSTGYIGRPDLTAAAFFTLHGHRAYRTGDIGHFDANGLLHFQGRRDGQIKLHGYRIELADIESNLLALPEVSEAVVLPVERGGVPQWLDAYVTRTSGVPPPEEAAAAAAHLRQELTGKLPSYMLPRSIHFISALPLTANGKVDRRKLTEEARK